MSAFGAPKETRTLTLESIGSLNRRVYLFHHRSKILENLIGSTSLNYQLNLLLVLCLDFDSKIVKGVPVRLHNIYSRDGKIVIYTLCLPISPHP